MLQGSPGPLRRVYRRWSTLCSSAGMGNSSRNTFRAQAAIIGAQRPLSRQGLGASPLNLAALVNYPTPRLRPRSLPAQPRLQLLGLSAPSLGRASEPPRSTSLAIIGAQRPLHNQGPGEDRATSRSVLCLKPPRRMWFFDPIPVAAFGEHPIRGRRVRGMSFFVENRLNQCRIDDR